MEQLTINESIENWIEIKQDIKKNKKEHFAKKTMIYTIDKFIEYLEMLNEPTTEVNTSKANLTIPVVMQWVAIEDELPKNDKQVFVQWDNGRFGINEYWETDKCWKYNFDGMNIKYWCEIKPPCA